MTLKLSDAHILNTDRAYVPQNESVVSKHNHKATVLTGDVTDRPAFEFIAYVKLLHFSSSLNREPCSCYAQTVPTTNPVPAFTTARTETPARIFSVPTEMPWGETWTESHLDQVVANWQANQAKGDPRFPSQPCYFVPAASVAVGHEQNSSIAQAYAERTDLPAVGWIADLHRDGPYLMATLDGIPEGLARWVNTGAYKRLSAEFYRDYQGFGPTLRRVSLLGADIPERKDLGDLPVLVYNPDAETAPNPAAFCEALQSFRRHKHARFAADIAGVGFVTFSESHTGANTMTPEQQALLTALQTALPGVDLSKIDGMALEQIMTACKVPAPAANAEVVEGTKDITAKNSEDNDEDDKSKDKGMAAFAEVMAKAIKGAVEPLQQQIATLTAANNGELAKRDREAVAAFCEAQRVAGKVYPFELDSKVGPTLVDQLLVLPSTTLATFAEGKLSPRAAMMKSIEARPPMAKYAERLPQPLEPNSAGRRAELLKHSSLGRSILAKEQASK